jgi:3-phenylpropionate/cinnamic acid dioxygenase small subunit
MHDQVLDVETREALRSLSVRYASGVDRRDRDRFLSAFHADAVLLVHAGGEASAPTGELRGHAELARVVELIERYRETFHLLGQGSYELAGTTATGEVYCLAHHLERSTEQPATVVTHIRYLDRYRVGDGGDWRIAERRVVVDWQEKHAHRPAVPT